MIPSRAQSAYRKVETQGKINPVKLIHMLYERVLVHLDLAMEAMQEGSPKKRGENLGKAIAIVTELNASIREDDHSEVSNFLRGLYGAILIELPKASINEDIKIVRQAYSYLKKLKEIWEQTAMQEHELPVPKPQEEAVPPGLPQQRRDYGGKPAESTAPRPSQSLSVSI